MEVIDQAIVELGRYDLIKILTILLACKKDLREEIASEFDVSNETAYRRIRSVRNALERLFELSS